MRADSFNHYLFVLKRKTLESTDISDANMAALEGALHVAGLVALNALTTLEDEIGRYRIPEEELQLLHQVVNIAIHSQGKRSCWPVAFVGRLLAANNKTRSELLAEMQR